MSCGCATTLAVGLSVCIRGIAYTLPTHELDTRSEMQGDASLTYSNVGA
jgi:hypothetical protein